MTHPAFWLGCLLGMVAGLSFALAEDSSPVYVTGKQFEQALDSPVSVAWSGLDLRAALRRIGVEKNFSILLDRRLDPNRSVDVEAGAGTPRTLLEQLAAAASGHARVVGNTIYLGPAATADKVRTVVELRRHELIDKSNDSRGRHLELSKGTAFSWNDLARPADLVRQICGKYQLEADGLEQVPHDLWAAAVLPQTNAVEALSLVLIQFDLTFSWTGKMQGIRIHPLPQIVEIERGHRPPRGMTANAAARKWREAFPALRIRSEQGQVFVTGTVEDHEAVERLSRPEKERAGGNPPSVNADELKLKRFTLRIKDARLRDVMQTLSNSPDAQLVFEYDADELKTARIDLDRLIEFDVKMATIGTVLESMFESTGLSFELKGRTVRLMAKPR